MTEQEAFEREVSSGVKQILHEMEHMAALPPEEANEPVAFNDARRRVIRQVWHIAREAVRYGAQQLQRN